MRERTSTSWCAILPLFCDGKQARSNVNPPLYIPSALYAEAASENPLACPGVPALPSTRTLALALT
jgi:hypothetical protein